MPILVSLLVVALFVLIALPGLAVVLKRRGAHFAAAFYAMLVLAAGAYHVGLPERAPAELTRPVPTLIGAEGAAGELCDRLLAQSRATGIIVGRTDAGQVQVNRTFWQQMPNEVTEAITSCLQAPSRPGAPQRDVTIVEVAPR
ncbi:hypothetical protein [Allosphingosinicella indica]|uniref:Uncharacterized protein n=1 Tax=Allosphingosinicella indica TaxID=941907 RepID=A0A1X7G1F8_9SPHN|nr:hypothetical protein [Allosphingosinicella indica]SMF62275.1 hypothetical protein SAMN06295910_0978 [Allosphingosinicella indica]